MAINFPSSPTLNDLHTDSNNVVWVCIDATAGDVQWARRGTSPYVNIDGGNADSAYLSTQIFDGGTA